MAVYNQSIIDKSKSLLKDIIEVYKDIYSKGEDLGILDDKGVNKDHALSTLKETYDYTLKFLKISDEDISEFPKNLEDTVK